MYAEQLPIKLSQEATLVLRNVEKLYDERVWWQARPELEGELCALRNDPKPTVLFRDESILTECSFVHELLHLWLQKLGFPNCEKTNPYEDNNWRTYSVSMLNGLFEHAIILPQLEAMGYSAYDAEERATRSELSRVVASIPHINDTNMSPTNAHALLFARAHLDCRATDVLELCSSVYSPPEFEPAKVLGGRIIKVVHQYAEEDIPRFRDGLAEAIDILHEGEFIRLESSPAV